VKRIAASALMVCTLLAWTAAAQEPPAADQAAAPSTDKIVATTEGPQVYVVKPGDTLWDISQRHFDTPWVWGKLWEQNRRVLNPHRIKPGMKLSLYPGMLELPQEAPSAPAAQPAPEPPKPPEPKLFCPLAGDIGYLSLDKTEPVATIFAAADPLKLTMGLGDTVYLHFTGPAPAVGSRLRVVHVSEEPVRHPVTNEPIGYKHTFPAVLEVREVREGTAEACVVEAWREIAAGDGVVPWFAMPQAVALKKGGPSAEGRLLAAQEYRYRMGDGQLIFIDLGSGDGLEPGRLLGLWRDEVSPDGVPLTGLEATRLGEAVVLLVREGTATALITDSRSELAEGDIVRTEP